MSSIVSSRCHRGIVVVDVAVVADIGVIVGSASVRHVTALAQPPHLGPRQCRSKLCTRRAPDVPHVCRAVQPPAESHVCSAARRIAPPAARWPDQPLERPSAGPAERAAARKRAWQRERAGTQLARARVRASHRGPRCAPPCGKDTQVSSGGDLLGPSPDSSVRTDWRARMSRGTSAGVSCGHRLVMMCWMHSVVERMPGAVLFCSVPAAKVRCANVGGGRQRLWGVGSAAAGLRTSPAGDRSPGRRFHLHMATSSGHRPLEGDLCGRLGVARLWGRAPL